MLVGVALDPADLPEVVLGFLAERHLATLTTLRPDGSPHVVPVGFAYDVRERLARVIAPAGSRKAANLRGGGRAVVCQVDGPRWVSLEGAAVVTAEPARVAAAEAAYAARYQAPRPRADRVAIEVRVDRVLGRA